MDPSNDPGGPADRESCGRCSFSTVVDAVSTDDPEHESPHDPFEGGHIEVEERDLRLVSAPAVVAGRLGRRLDDLAERLIYGRED
ncbi:MULTISPECIES: hypothetical protein [Saliphagus]|uniref:Uncharacterized protein n=1 Tax=Saliphagus infecundisoli TaxID=1849069 RepID=A0ABD5QB67_9EURY|nr:MULTISPECIES: hypothetical protein [Saliphagus]